MVARLNDLSAAPAFEEAASALIPGGVCWPPYGTKEFPVAGGRADARSFQVVRADWRSACGNCGNQSRQRRSTPDGVPGPPYGTQELPVAGRRVDALLFRVFGADWRSACGNCGNRSRQRRSTPHDVPGPPYGRKNCWSPAGASTHSCFVSPALIGAVLAGIAEMGAGRAAHIRSPFRASIRSERVRGRRRARRRHLVFVFSALIGQTLAAIAESRAIRRSPGTVVGPGR
jgi:hypothetical protein